MEIKKLLKHKIIPKNSSDITSDKVLYFDENYLITQWEAKDSEMGIASALSIISVEHGLQISKKIDKENKFRYWYCDLVKTKWTKETGCFEITDLLVDVVVFANSDLQIIDLDEFIKAKNENLISHSDFQWAHKSVLKLVDRALLGDFPPKSLFEPIIDHIPSDFFKAD